MRRNAFLPWLFSILQFLPSSDAQTCYGSVTKYRTVTTYTTAYQSSSYGCDWFLWHWSTCYRSVSYSVAQPTTQIYYTQSAYCCSGFAGSPCSDINECSSSSSNNCVSPAYCVNNFGSYTCACPAGYVLNSNGRSCSDVNECSSGSHNCYSSSYCSNTVGGYTCNCPGGYQLQSNGYSCSDINECTTGSHQCYSASYCTNTPGGYVCSCPVGYLLSSDGHTCQEVNECSSGSHNCYDSSHCDNTPGSFTCSCPSGYVLSGNGYSCLDVNECSAGTHNCFSAAYCINTAGSFVCSCPTGYSKQSDGYTCTDINECYSGDHDCFSDQYCHNSAGNYSCSCPPGYQLQSDAVTCTDIDECLELSDGCEQICLNNPGSYVCSCALGCILSQDQHSCTDVNECLNGTSGCGQLCTNLPCQSGRYTCSCYEVGEYFLGPDNHTCFHGATVTDLPLNVSRLYAETVTLQCTAFGFPLPTISWLKDKLSIVPSSPRITIQNSTTSGSGGNTTSTLSISQLTVLDEGEYKCNAVNILPAGLSQDSSATVLNITEILVVNVSGYTTSALSIYLSWEKPADTYLRSLVESYHVHIEEIETGQNWTETSQHTVINITSLHPHYSYRLAVAATTNDTVQPYSTPVILTTFQAAPSSAPINAMINLITSSTVNISWDPPPSQYKNGIILYNIILLTDLQNELEQQLTTTSNWVLVTDLHPHYIYSFKIAAVTVSHGPFNDAQNFTTLEDVPSAAPVVIAADPITSTSIMLSWEPPSIEMQNGIIREFWVDIVETKTTSNLRITTTITSSTISGLHPNYDYNITITAVTIGPGPSSPPVTITTLEDVPSGFPTNVTAAATSPTSAKLTWSPPPSEQQNGIITDYVVIITNAGNGDNFSLSTNQTFLSIDFLMPFRIYNFLIAAQTQIGIGPFTNEGLFINTPEAAPSAPPTALHVIPGSVSSTGFLLKWNEPLLEHQNGIIDYYVINVVEIETNSAMLYTTINMSLTLQYLHPFYTYKLKVAAFTVEMGPFSQPINVTTDQDAPSGFPLSFSGSAISSTEIQLNWSPPSQEDQNGIIIRYLLDVIALNRNHTLEINVTTTAAYANNLKPYTIYSCVVAAETVSGLGPFSSPIIINTLEDVPSDAPLNPSVSILDSESINIMWYPPAFENQNGMIVYYVVSVIEVGTGNVSEYISYSTTHYITSLHPHYQYSIKIAAVTIAQGPFTEEIVILMPEDAPATSPLNIDSFALSSMSIVISWDAPLPQNQNGLIRSYIVNVTEVETGENFGVTVHNTSITLESLHPNYNYRFTIIAVTVLPGPASSTFTIKTEEDVPSGPVLNTVGIVTSPTSAVLSWDPPLPDQQNGVIKGYVVNMTMIEDNEMFQLVSNSTAIEIITLSPFRTYHCVVAAYTSIGVGPFGTEVNINTPQSAPSAPPINIVVSSSSVTSTGFIITWDPPTIKHQNGVVTSYTIIVLEENTGLLFEHNSFSTSLSIHSLHPAYTYQCRIAAYTVAQGPFSDQINVTTDEESPSGTPQNFHVKNISSTSVSISWSPPIPEEQNGYIVSYLLNYTTFQMGDMNHVSTSDTSHLIVGLRPFTKYLCSVSAATSVGQGPFSTSVTFQTLEDAPDSAPSITTVYSVDSTTVAIFWDPPSPADHNGIIRDYRINVDNINSGQIEEVISTKTIAIIGELTPSFVYAFSVSAHTIASGPYSPKVNITMPEDAPSGFPQNFTGHTVSADSIFLSWSPPVKEERNGVITHYTVEVTHTLTHDTTHYTTIVEHITLSQLDPFVSYACAVSAATAVGTGPLSNLVLVQTLESAPDSAPQSPQAIAVSPTSIHLSWDPPPIDDHNGVIDEYHVNITEDETGIWFEEVTNQTQITIQGLHPFYTYHYYVVAVTVDKGPPSAVVFVVTKEDAPAASPQQVNLTAINSTSISISWSAPPLKQQNGIIRHYEVVIENDATGELHMTSTISTSITIYLLKPFSIYHCRVAAVTVAMGPFSMDLNITTPQDLPSSPPEDFVTIAVSPSTLMLQWDPPILSERNGIIQHYIVTLAEQETNNTSQILAYENNVTVYYLHPFFTYVVAVSAVTIGPGPAVVDSIQMPEDVPTAMLENILITVKYSTTATLMWNELPLQHQNGLIRKYIINVTETNTGTYFQDTSLTESIVLDNLHPFYSYSVSIAAYTIDEGPYSLPVTFTMLEDVPSSPPTNLSSVVISPRDAQLLWSPPPLAGQNGVITSYTVTVTNTQTGEKHTYITGATSLSLNSLFPHTIYKSAVAANTTIGMGPFTTIIVFITPEDVPNAAPADLSGEALSSTSVALSWQPPTPDMQNGIIRLYNVTIFETDTGKTFSLSAIQTSITVSSLHPYYTYHCSVAAVTVGLGPFSSPIKIQTLTDVPSSSPGSVMASANGSSSLIVSWLSIPFHEANGIIQYYYVNVSVINTFESFHVETNETILVLNELHPFYTYLISVSAFTTGLGPFSQEVSLTLPQDAPSGPPRDLSVDTVTSSSLQLSWEPPALEEQNGLVQSYNIIVFETVTNLTKIVYQDFQHHSISITGLHPYYNYELSVAAFTVAMGPFASTTVQTKQDVPSSPPNNVTVKIQNSSVVLITWTAPDENQQNGPIQYYSLSLADGKTGLTQEHTSTNTSITITHLHPSFTYTMNISAVTIGVGAKLTSLFQMPEDVPADPPTNLKVEILGPRSIIASWGPPPPLSQNGIIIFYTIILRHNSSGWEKVHNSTDTSLIFSALSPYTMYQCTVAASTAVGAGPFSDHVMIQTPQDVPTGPPLQFTVSDVQSTSFSLSWFPPEIGERNGIIENYVVVCNVINNATSHAINTNLTTLLLSMLHPYYQYNCSVAAMTAVGAGPLTAPLTVMTLEDVPQLSPESLVVTATSEHTLIISWNELSQDEANGVVRYYTVKVRVSESAEQFEHTTQDTHLIFNNTHPYYTYSVKVAAYTIGTGPYTDEVSVVTPQEAPSGVPQNLTVVFVTSESMQLSWDTPLQDQQNGVIQSYSIVVFEKYSNTTLRVYQDYPNKTIVIDSLHPYYDYQISVAANTIAQGPFALVNVLTKQDAPSTAPQDLVIIVQNSSSMYLQWNPPDPDKQNGVIQYYSIVLTGIESASTMTYTTNTTSFAINTLHAAYTYVLEIATVTVSFGPVANESFTMEEDVPSGFPEAFTAHSLTSTSIQLSWHPPPPESQNGYIQDYEVFVLNKNLTTNFTHVTHQTQLNLVGLNPFSIYECAVAASTSIGIGPFTNWLVFQTKEDLPTSPPVNVSGTVLSSNIIKVFWDALAVDVANGIVRKYVLNVTVLESQESWSLETPRTNITLNELHPFYTFIIQVAAYTVGPGPFSHPHSLKTLQDAPSGPPQEIISNNITATSILFSWIPPLPELQNGVIESYVVTVFEADTDSLLQIYNNHNTTSIFLTNLHPFYSYQVSVSAKTVSVGPSGTANATTLEAGPSGPPRNIVVIKLNSTSIHITWNAPEVTLQNGLIRGYTIKSTETETQSETIYSVQDTSEIILDKLHPFYNYELLIAALTIELGPFSDLITIQLPESTPSIAPQGFNAELMNETTLDMFFSWHSIPQELTNGQLLGYNLICTTENGTVVLSATSSGSSLHATHVFVNSNHYTCLLCGFTSVGCGPQTALHISTYPDSPVGPPKNLIVFAGTTLIQLQWQSPFDPKGHISGYVVLYQLLLTNTSLTSPRPLVTLTTGASETEVVLRPLLEDSLYRIIVYAETNTSTGPGSEELHVFTKPHATNAPMDFQCPPLDSHTLACQWTPPKDIDVSFYILSYKLADGFDYHIDYGDVLETANITQMMQTFTINGLQPYSGYVVELDMYVPEFEDLEPNISGEQPGEGESYTTSIVNTTLPEVPDASIEQLSTKTFNETSIKIYWIPPARIHWKGIIFYYIMVSNLGPLVAGITKEGSTILSTSVTFHPQSNHPDPSLATEPLLHEIYLLEKLEENYQYSISVTIANNAGIGKSSLAVIHKMPESIPSGPPTNIHSSNITSTSITLSWAPPTPVDANGIITGYTLHFNRILAGDTSEYDLESDELLFTKYGLQPYELVSISIAAKNSKGEGPFSPEVTYRTTETLPSAPRSLEARQENTNTISLSWKPPQYLNGELLGYQVAYRSIESLGTKMTKDGPGVLALPISENPKAVIANLLEGSLYKFEVSAWNRAGYGENSSITLYLEISEKTSSFPVANTIITAIVFACVIFTCIALLVVVIYLIVARSRKKRESEAGGAQRSTDEAGDVDISLQLSKEDEANQDYADDRVIHLEEEIKETLFLDSDNTI